MLKKQLNTITKKTIKKIYLLYAIPIILFVVLLISISGTNKNIVGYETPYSDNYSHITSTNLGTGVSFSLKESMRLCSIYIHNQTSGYYYGAVTGGGRTIEQNIHSGSYNSTTKVFNMDILLSPNTVYVAYVRPRDIYTHYAITVFPDPTGIDTGNIIWGIGYYIYISFYSGRNIYPVTGTPKAFSIEGLKLIPEDQSCDSYCGDGIIDLREQCDEGLSNGIPCIAEYNKSCEYCSDNCSLIEVNGSNCGDDILDDSEECDDGNIIDGDGCSSSCSIEHFCGDGICDEDETCETCPKDCGECPTCWFCFCTAGNFIICLLILIAVITSIILIVRKSTKKKKKN